MAREGDTEDFQKGDRQTYRYPSVLTFPISSYRSYFVIGFRGWR